MINAHRHGIPCAEDVRSFICAAQECEWKDLLGVKAPHRIFLGVHPWHAEEVKDCAQVAAHLEALLREYPEAGVGEIGLDRLHTKVTTPAQHALFTAQLEVAAALHRPVTLHGAKCWGEVVKACKPYADEIPSFLFHGFSRSAGLLPEIYALNGYISVGAAILNDHALNYRNLVKNLRPDRILLETDDSPADIYAIAAHVSIPEEALDLNATNFLRHAI